MPHFPITRELLTHYHFCEVAVYIVPSYRKIPASPGLPLSPLGTSIIQLVNFIVLSESVQMHICLWIFQYIRIQAEYSTVTMLIPRQRQCCRIAMQIKRGGGQSATADGEFKCESC